MSDDGLYVGFDASTQGLTAVVVEVAAGRFDHVTTRSLGYDDAFPQYGTRHGVLPSEEPSVATAPPHMWADALERMLGVLTDDIDLSRLRAVSGAAQQHGTVYLRGPIHPDASAELTRPVAPIWMDASTTADCDAITRALGGPEAVARITGSQAAERFAGPQIRKFARADPDGYASTGRIHLVSSFHASLLIGSDAPVEPGDAAGMNLMDLRRGAWHAEALRATAPDLQRRLPGIVPSDTVIGHLSAAWQDRFGMPPAAVVAWTGDNPSSLIGLGLTVPEPLAISLGTSDTVFRVMESPRVPATGSHVFGAPMGGFMGLTCFQNGGLARERVRDRYGLGWDGFAALLRATRPGNEGRLMLPWFEAELTPRTGVLGVQRLQLDPADAAGNVRAVVESQALAMARHSAWMGNASSRVLAAGGATASPEILQVFADVFNAEVVVVGSGNAAALGAALRAWHAYSGKRSWEDVTAGLTDLAVPPVRPDPEAVRIYADLRDRHRAFEKRAIRS